jgi:hypothetical protein
VKAIRIAAQPLQEELPKLKLERLGFRRKLKPRAVVRPEAIFVAEKAFAARSHIILVGQEHLWKERVTGQSSLWRRDAKMPYSPDMARGNEHRIPPQVSEVAPADDVRTIMLNQVSWGAVFAGGTIALVTQIILNMVGIGIGLSTVDVAAGILRVPNPSR